MEWQWETQKRISGKRVGKGQVVQPSGTSWDKLEYVGQVGQGERGLQILVGQVWQGEGGLQIFVGQVGQGQGVCPLEPFHLSQMGLQCRGIVALLAADKIGDSTNLKLEILVQNVSFWSSNQCTTYCSTLHRLERWWSRENECLRT